MDNIFKLFSAKKNDIDSVTDAYNMGVAALALVVLLGFGVRTARTPETLWGAVSHTSEKASDDETG